MVRATLDQLRQDFPSYLRRVEAGETVVIVREEMPVAELKPLATAVTAQRPIGLAAGEFTVPDDFDAPLPPEVVGDFECR